MAEYLVAIFPVIGAGLFVSEGAEAAARHSSASGQRGMPGGSETAQSGDNGEPEIKINA